MCLVNNFLSYRISNINQRSAQLVMSVNLIGNVANYRLKVLGQHDIDSIYHEIREIVEVQYLPVLMVLMYESREKRGCGDEYLASVVYFGLRKIKKRTVLYVDTGDLASVEYSVD